MAKTAPAADDRKASRQARARTAAERAANPDLTAGDPDLEPIDASPQTKADRKKAAHQEHDPIPQPKNPPDQPKMIPARQVEGVTSQALDPEDQPAHNLDQAKAIRVQAKAIGYYGDNLRRVGDVFDIADEKAFSDKWMRRVPKRTPERVTGSNASLERAKKGEDVNREAARDSAFRNENEPPATEETRTQSDQAPLGES